MTPAAKPTPPVEVEPGGRRAEIRADAAKVFGHLGFAHATMRDVADGTGILPGSLYHHFRSKDELLLEIMCTFNDDLLRDMHAVIDDEDDPLERITNLIRLALRYIIERPDESRVLANDAPYIATAPALTAIATGSAEAERIWMTQLRKGIKSGALRPGLDPSIAYATLMGSIFSLLRWYRPTGRAPAAKLSEHVCDQLLEGLVARP